MHRWRALHDAWWRLATQAPPRSLPDVLAASVLRAGSIAYGAGVSLRNAAYDRGWLKQVRLPARVVSVGNMTVGGVGKTACVELLARQLTAHGQRVAILSRGYGGLQRDYWLRCDGGRLSVGGNADVAANGLADEPQLLAMHLEGTPVIVGARRDRTGQLACAQFAPQTIILDDGFQHRRLARDCEIVLIHARMPFGGWALFPRGPMREPLASLKRAHVIIVTKSDEALERLGALSERLRSLNPKAALVTAVHEPIGVLEVRSGERQDVQRLEGLRVGLVSSIGDPAGFETTVRRLHATVLWHRSFPDHYRYRAADAAALRDDVDRTRPDAVLTTEKDWIRLRTMDYGLWTAPIWVLGVRMRIIAGEEALDARLAALQTR